MGVRFLLEAGAGNPGPSGSAARSLLTAGCLAVRLSTLLSPGNLVLHWLPCSPLLSPYGPFDDSCHPPVSVSHPKTLSHPHLVPSATDWLVVPVSGMRPRDQACRCPELAVTQSPGSCLKSGFATSQGDSLPLLSPQEPQTKQRLCCVPTHHVLSGHKPPKGSRCARFKSPGALRLSLRHVSCVPFICFPPSAENEQSGHAT